jgi:hypothetical protein
VKISITGYDLGLILGDIPYVIGPSSRGLDRGLDRLRARVHDEYLFFAAKFREFLGEQRELLRVKCSRGQRKLIKLSMSDLGDSIITVSEIQRAVGAEEIKVPMSINIRYPYALS